MKFISLQNNFFLKENNMKAKNRIKNTFNTRTNIFLFLYPFVFVIFLSGCSVTGALIGSAIKTKTNAPERSFEIDKVHKEIVNKDNSYIKVFLKNDDVLEGFYRGKDILPLDEYKTVYKERSSKLSLDFKLPYPGDTLIFSMREGNMVDQKKNSTHSYIFEGFDLDRILLKDQKNNTKLYYLNDIYSPNTNLSRINALIISGELPSRTIWKITTLDGSKMIIDSDIYCVEYQKRKRYTLTGFFIGLFVDIAIYLIYPGLYYLLFYFLNF